MRRVKSAPANLAEMQNRRTPSILIKSTKKKIDESKININNILPINIFNCYNNNNNNNNDNNNNNNNNDTKNNNKDKTQSITKRLNLVRNTKFTLRHISTFSGDFLQNNLKMEESILLCCIIEYFSENIFKREKLDQLRNYMIIFMLRYIFNLYIQDKITTTFNDILPLDLIKNLIN
tara:strand:- start:1602 stop:2132 length:531 start_codon:yes stop_codon:yes gene_type:complete